MRWVRIARALLRPVIALVNTAIDTAERVHDRLLGARYRLIVADMSLAAKITTKQLTDLIKRLSEGKLCGFAEELGMGSSDIIEYLESMNCKLMKIIDFDDMVNADYVLGCPKIKREVTVSSNIKIREWVCVSWSEEEEDKLRHKGEPKVVYVDEF